MNDLFKLELDEPPLSISLLIEECLQEFGYVFQSPTPGDTRFHIRVEGNRRYRSQLLVSPEGVVRFYSFLTDEPYPQRYQKRIRHLAERLNGTIVWGRYAFEPETGAVSYRDALASNQVIHALDISALLNRSAIPVKLWTTAYEIVCSGTSDEVAAAFSILWNHCEDDESNMTDEKRRALWEIATADTPSEFEKLTDPKSVQPPTLMLV